MWWHYTCNKLELLDAHTTRGVWRLWPSASSPPWQVSGVAGLGQQAAFLATRVLPGLHVLWVLILDEAVQEPHKSLQDLLLCGGARDLCKKTARQSQSLPRTLFLSNFRAPRSLGSLLTLYPQLHHSAMTALDVQELSLSRTSPWHCSSASCLKAGADLSTSIPVFEYVAIAP